MRPTRRAVLGWTAGLAACAEAPPPEPLPPPDPWARPTNGKKPLSLLVILCDDLRADVLGCAGHRVAKTPNIDRLAREGHSFDRAFVTTSLCGPSRATLWTGHYAHRHGILHNEADLPESAATWPKMLQSAGYHTAFIGKWHLGSASAAPRPGWDHWVGFRGQGQYVYPGPERLAPIDRSFNVDGTLQRMNGYVTDLLTDAGVRAIRSAPADKPFAVVVSHKAVHAPFVPAERHLGAYADVAGPSPLANTDAAYEGRPQWIRRMREGEFSADAPYSGRWPDLGAWYRDYLRTLLAVDEGVGKLLDALAEAGRLEDTVVLFTSDNGFMAGERGVVDKRNFYEESIRIPWILRGPPVARPGSRCTSMVLNLDWMPTLLDAAGLVPPEDGDGVTVLPLVGDQPPPGRTEWLYEYFFEPAFPQTPTVLGVRTATHKFVHYHGVWERNELFDLANDPGEVANLIDDPAHADRVRGMSGRLRRLAARHGLSLEPRWDRPAEEPPVEGGESAPTGAE